MIGINAAGSIAFLSTYDKRELTRTTYRDVDSVSERAAIARTRSIADASPPRLQPLLHFPSIAAHSFPRLIS